MLLGDEAARPRTWLGERYDTPLRRLHREQPSPSSQSVIIEKYPVSLVVGTSVTRLHALTICLFCFQTKGQPGYPCTPARRLLRGISKQGDVTPYASTARANSFK